jgi:sugar lactone lactonase YvrE
MRLLSIVLALALPAVAGCGIQPSNQSSLPSVSAQLARSTMRAPVATFRSSKAKQNAYWTFFYAQPNPQIEIAKLPLKSTSKVTQIDGNGSNQLVCANAIRTVGKTLWIMNLSPCHASDSSVVQVYSLPLTSNSKPNKTFVLSGPMDADHMAFDASGNLWVPSFGNSSVYEYTGPFTSSGTLQPAKTLTLGLKTPQGLGFDSTGNLYVANTGTTSGKNAIAVFKNPISNRKPFFLKGVVSPSGLTFDRSGNLYVSSNATTGAIAQYASNHLKAGDSPSIIDSTGLAPSPYGADLIFDRAGNLYDADCGKTTGIYSYPIATKPFSSTLAPSFYSNSSIQSVGCVWGIDIH